MSLVFNYHKDLPKVTPLKEEYLKNQVLTIKKIFQPIQKSKEWYEMRSNMLTASDWGTVLGENHYSNSNEVLKKKCGDDNFVTNAAMQWGNKYEEVAVLIYKNRNNVEIWDFGCLRHPSIPFLGASPDGITPDGIMLEIKCPTSRKITGIPPRYYWCQVQGQLEVCELDRCDFLECALKEYGSETEYLNDHFENNHKLNKFGNEKGLVAEFFKKDTKSFYFDYSPVCIIDDELTNWKNKTIEKHTENNSNIMYSSFSYWYLEEVSCIPIYRNQEWFNEAKIILGEFWNKVLKYRELGLPKLYEDLQNEKDEKKQIRLMKKEETIIKKESLKKGRVVKKEDSTKKQKKIREFIILDDIPNESIKAINKNDDNKLSENSSSNDTKDTEDTEDEDEDDFVFQTQTTTSLFSSKSIFK